MDTRQFLYYSMIILRCIVANEAYHILGIFPVTSRSHFAVHRTLMEGLASTGHQVTVASFFNDTSTSTNYRTIQLSGVEIFVDNLVPEEAKESRFGLLQYLLMIRDSFYEMDMCHAVYKNEYFKRLLTGQIRPLPDLLIAESFHVPCYCSLAEKFDLPIVYTVTAMYVRGTDFAIGNPVHPAYMPHVTNEYTQNMNFYQRAINSLHYVSIYIVHYLWGIPKAIEIDKIYVRNDDITDEKLNRRTSLILSNSHFSLLNRPLVPNAIDIGGIHIKEAKPLPSDLQKFIEEAEDGVIFFSFGTTVKMSAMADDKLDAFKKAFSKIPQRVLWRSDVVNLTDVSANVIIRQWFPQRDILEHKNVKAFISHGGVSGIYEAIHTTTPIIGVPILYDQFGNINILKEKGAAIYLDYDDIRYDTLLKALKDIIDNSRYRENMQHLSTLFKDRPMSPIDTAVYWIEYVIRHKGAAHLRVPSADMPFYKFLLLDIVCFLMGFISIALWIVYTFLKSILRHYDIKSITMLKKTQ